MFRVSNVIYSLLLRVTFQITFDKQKFDPNKLSCLSLVITSITYANLFMYTTTFCQLIYLSKINLSKKQASRNARLSNQLFLVLKCLFVS